MSTDIPALVEALKKDAGDYRIIMEYPPTSDQLSWDQREVRAYEAAVALEREHQRAEALFRENYDLGRERDAAVQREAIQTRIAANNDRAFRSAVDRRVEIEAERDAAVQQAERAEAEVEGMLSDSTRWMNRAIPAEAQRDRYKAAIREALDIRRTANLLPAEMVYQVFRILSAALDTEKGEAS